jgi:hypothetical protein
MDGNDFLRIAWAIEHQQPAREIKPAGQPLLQDLFCALAASGGGQQYRSDAVGLGIRFA